MTTHFFRIAKSDPPTVADFLSNAARGRRIPADLPADLHRLWDGLSMYSSVDVAVRTALRAPYLGRFVATLDLDHAVSARWEQTTPNPWHYTVWGKPEELLKCVVSVNPILVARPRP